MVKGIEELDEDERRALRGSKFAPLPSLPPPRSQPRLAHPGGPLTTNKAAALAKFLERKLQDPEGLDSINPDLIELAVKNAKRTVLKGATSSSEIAIRHVESFGDSEPSSEEETIQESVSENKKNKKKKKNKNKNKNMKQRKKKNKKTKVTGNDATLTRPKKKLKL